MFVLDADHAKLLNADAKKQTWRKPSLSIGTCDATLGYARRF
jgi:hypothetical protein